MTGRVARAARPVPLEVGLAGLQRDRLTVMDWTIGARHPLRRVRATGARHRSPRTNNASEAPLLASNLRGRRVGAMATTQPKAVENLKQETDVQSALKEVQAPEQAPPRPSGVKKRT